MNVRSLRAAAICALTLFLFHALLPAADEKEPLKLTLRSRAKGEDDRFAVVEKKVGWDPKKTAIIICDMWDDHWCRSAARRVSELAGPLNETVKAARAKGVFVIHAPSTVTKFYKDTPQRKGAKDAPFAKTPVPLSTDERWGTAWCWPDPKREPALPIDDEDMGCDCAARCKVRDAWTRQIAAIAIADEDAITDNGQETWNLLEQRGIKNVMLVGVHANMCVLGRPFGLRQMVKNGKNTVLVRDLTDTMYTPRRRPHVSHFRGTQLIIEYIELAVCPTVSSDELLGGRPFRFKGDTGS